MEGTHNLYTGRAQIGLTTAELAAFNTRGEVLDVHPGLGKQVEIFKVSQMPPSGRTDKLGPAPSARFDPNGNLSIALPMSHGEELELPLTIPHEEIKPSFHTDYYFGKAGEIILSAVGR